MVKTVSLTSFKIERSALVTIVNRKIATSKILNTNELMNGKLKIEINSLTELLNGIEAKFRKCEMTYEAYFANVDHGVLSGNAGSLPFSMDCTFLDGTAALHYVYDCDDKLLYKELTDMNFQNFILMIASIYENVVFLGEIILKKVIVHTKEKTPISFPLLDYLGFLKILISLGYRSNDELNQCTTTFEPYFQLYLSTINQLRNRFIHGYSINLSSDGFNYKVSNYAQGAFTPSSPLLNIDIFTLTVLDNTRSFIKAFYTALERTIRHYRKSLPA